MLLYCCLSNYFHTFNLEGGFTVVFSLSTVISSSTAARLKFREILGMIAEYES